MKNTFLLFMLSLLTACGSMPATDSGLYPEKFIAEKDGKQTALYTIRNKNGMEVCLSNYGGRIVSIMVPDKTGKYRDVVLGFDNIRDYMEIPNKMGTTIGRYANRIAGGQFLMDGDTIRLPQNNGRNCLHGGYTGWDKKVMETAIINGHQLEMSLVSPDGEEDFPGTVHARIRFTVTNDNALEIRYEAATDRKTPINLTNHSFFNLDGRPDQEITGHLLYINADTYTPVDSTGIPTGEFAPVANTPMDFRTPKKIGQDIDAEFPQLKAQNGYDHNWVLSTEGSVTELAAKAWSEASGIQLEVFTDEPGIQVFTANLFKGAFCGKNGIRYGRRSAFCLETQHFPDSPNHPDWPDTFLKPAETYSSTCIYRFSIKE